MYGRAFFALIAVGALALGVACEDSSSVPAGNHNRSYFDGGSGGITPPGPDPNFDPDSLLDSGAPNGDAVCEGTPVGTGTVDQENLYESGGAHLTPTTGKPYQTFTAGETGWLAGIELAVQRAEVGSGETIGKMRVELYTYPGHELLAGSELPLTNFPRAKPRSEDRRITLSSGIGAGYFPFADSCVRLTAGTQYYFRMMLADVPDGVCGDVTDAGTCTVGRVGDPCTEHARHCDTDIWVSMTTSANPYDAGGWNGGATGDFTFRTYVQP
ncbi:MAG: hypothetical protein KF850_05935 [Labilithrix sp.]|nr:hypothetical protein [Labilithrix sp.]